MTISCFVKDFNNGRYTSKNAYPASADPDKLPTGFVTRVGELAFMSTWTQITDKLNALVKEEATAYSTDTNTQRSYRDHLKTVINNILQTARGKISRDSLDLVRGLSVFSPTIYE